MDLAQTLGKCFLLACLCILSTRGQTALRLNQRSGPECTLPLDSGFCSSNITRFYFDLGTQTCKSFTFRGCGGNLNNYATEIDCNLRCICSRPSEPGNGRENLVRFYYDVSSGKCEQYSFNGRGGNSNRFRTAEECGRTCGVPDMNSPRRCDRMPDFGRNCWNNTIRYYYDKNCDCCREFTYLGCDGNGNRFETEALCQSKCVAKGNQPTTLAPRPNPASRPRICYAQPAQGPCSQRIERYHFDASTSTCKTFQYSGCGGNGNSFMLPTDCVNVCQASSSALPTTTTPKPVPSQCTLPLQRGNCDRIMLRFYFNESTRSCRVFLYSGCNGNVNNFLTLMNCLETCNASMANIS